MLSPLSHLPPERPLGDVRPMLDVRLPSHAGELGAARQHVERAARTFGLDERDCFDFVFAVNEAVTNAVRYGVQDDDSTVGLRIAADGPALMVTVFNDGSFVPAAGCLDPLAESGRGFHYMRLLADDVRVQCTPLGTAVHLRKFRRTDDTQ